MTSEETEESGDKQEDEGNLRKDITAVDYAVSSLPPMKDNFKVSKRLSFLTDKILSLLVTRRTGKQRVPEFIGCPGYFRSLVCKTVVSSLK